MTQMEEYKITNYITSFELVEKVIDKARQTEASKNWLVRMIEVEKESKKPLTDDTTYALIEGLLPQLDQNEKLNFGYMNPVEKPSIVTMKYKGGGTCDGSFSTIEECVFEGKFTAVETY